MALTPDEAKSVLNALREFSDESPEIKAAMQWADKKLFGQPVPTKYCRVELEVDYEGVDYGPQQDLINRIFEKLAEKGIDDSQLDDATEGKVFYRVENPYEADHSSSSVMRHTFFIDNLTDTALQAVGRTQSP